MISVVFSNFNDDDVATNEKHHKKWINDGTHKPNVANRQIVTYAYSIRTLILGNICGFINMNKKNFSPHACECVNVVRIALNFRLFLFPLFYRIVVFFVAFPKLKTLPHSKVTEIVYYLVNCISIAFFSYASRLPHIEIQNLKSTSTNRFDSILRFTSFWARCADHKPFFHLFCLLCI